MSHARIIDHLNWSSCRCGRLLNWQRHSDPFWHYGIGLSDTIIFDTGGLQPFERVNAKFVELSESEFISPKKVIRRLCHAVDYFSSWHYNLLGWNCEHFGRLVATGKPRCYQSKTIWWACDLTPKGDHKTAKRLYEAYLQRTDPEALICH